jgi:hypothetical protein
MSRGWTACWVVLLSSLSVRAGDETLPPTKLTLRPAALPSPALRYRLLPELREQKPGNAAPHYLRAAEVLKANGRVGDERQELQERLLNSTSSGTARPGSGSGGPWPCGCSASTRRPSGR